MIGLDLVERYAWTVFDFLARGPKRFYAMRENNPARYMDPVPFMIVNFLFWQAVITVTVTVLSSLWNWNEVIGFDVPTFVRMDYKDQIAITGPSNIFLIFISACWLMLAAKLVGRKLPLKDALIALCYASSTTVLMVAIVGFATSMSFLTYMGLAALEELTTETGADIDRAAAMNYVGRAIYISFQATGFVAFGYVIASAAAIVDVTFLKMLRGVLLSLLLVVLASMFLGFLIAVLIIFFIYSA